MSIGTIQQISARNEALRNDQDAGRVAEDPRRFGQLLATLSAGGVKGDGSSKASKAAEILQLEMMRSAISLESSIPTQSSRVNLAADGISSLLAAYGIDPKKKDIPAAVNAPTEAAPPVAEGGVVAPQPALQPKSPSAGISTIISRASQRYGVEEGLIRAVIQVESNFKPTAVSPVGARGLMQLMPATAASLGVSDSFDPEQNIMAGTRFLKDMLNRYGGNVDKALAAYNWGPGNLDRGKGRLPRETQDYLVKVKKLYADQQTV